MGIDLVVMDNNLIRASYKLTANEMRLILVALSQIPKGEEIDPNKAYYISKDDFVRLGVAPNNVAREIREACSDLLSRVVTIDTPIGDLHAHWVLNILHFKTEVFERLKKEYPNAKNDGEFINTLRLHNLLDSLPVIAKSDENIIARIVFHPNMIPYISQLKQQFTKLNLEDVFGFGSFYSYRIYLMMMQFKSTGYCKIHLDELRKTLDLKETYPMVADIKRWVIDTAVNEINEKSPYTVKYELIKTGRKFTHLELKFKEKKTEKGQLKCSKTIDMFEEAQDTFVRMSEQQLSTFCTKLADLPEVQAMADAGEDMKPFIARLRSMLESPEKQKKLLPYLKEIGFKTHKS